MWIDSIPVLGGCGLYMPRWYLPEGEIKLRAFGARYKGRVMGDQGLIPPGIIPGGELAAADFDSGAYIPDGPLVKGRTEPIKIIFPAL